jgi:hypothetical protein
MREFVGLLNRFAIALCWAGRIDWSGSAEVHLDPRARKVRSMELARLRVYWLLQGPFRHGIRFSHLVLFPAASSHAHSFNQEWMV